MEVEEASKYLCNIQCKSGSNKYFFYLVDFCWAHELRHLSTERATRSLVEVAEGVISP